MRAFAEACDLIAATTKKLEKTTILANYLKGCSPREAAVSAVFFSGCPFAAWEQITLQVGGTLLWRLVAGLSGKSEAELRESYRRLGDLGLVAAEVLTNRPAENLSVVEVQEEFRAVTSIRGPAAKAARVRELLLKLTPQEAKYVIKIITGDLRIGLKESLVEEAIAKAYHVTLAEVQRANMLLGDIGETLARSFEGTLTEARMRLFHPLGFMLASPAETAEDGLGHFHDAWVEDKYDGIRAHVHCSGPDVRIFSRTRDDITSSWPELTDALTSFTEEVVLDGEIVAWSYLAAEGNETGRALPFSALQQRLGRKQVTDELIRSVPVAFLVFDVLYANGELLIDRPLAERSGTLNRLLASRGPALPRQRHVQSLLDFGPEAPHQPTQVLRAPVFQATTPAELEKLFEASQARGNEGLMIKDPKSPYTPGRRGKSWLKLKRELATLDVVVTAVEYGHGKRIGVLSDYTFAVRDGDNLLDIGKAYSGLTDAEIAEMTGWFREHIVQDQGLRLVVEPKTVLEVAFNNMMRSDRHASGYALRFPRIVRLRPDKSPEDADTIERAKEIYSMQK